MSQPLPSGGYLVKLLREPPNDYFVLTLPDGSSEELSPEETRIWFHRRGANMDKLEKALDYTWQGFCAIRDVYFNIENYREPVSPVDRVTPRV